MWSFHELAIFIVRFIPNFSIIMAPLTDSMHDGKFLWMEKADHAFKLIKQIFVTVHVFVLQDIFTLQTSL